MDPYTRALEDERDDLYLETLEAKGEIEQLTDLVDDLKTRLILRQEELLALYRA